MRYDAQAVLDAESPGEDRDDAGGGEKPEPEGGEEGGYEVDHPVGEPGEDIKRPAEIVCPGVEYV